MKWLAVWILLVAGGWMLFSLFTVAVWIVFNEVSRHRARKVVRPVTSLVECPPCPSPAGRASTVRPADRACPGRHAAAGRTFTLHKGDEA